MTRPSCEDEGEEFTARGVEESDDNGERGRVVGLDLDSGVVRLRAARPKDDEEHEPAAE